MKARLLRRSLSLGEALGIVLLITVLAVGGSYSLAWVQDWLLLRRSLEAWPTLCEGVRAQRLLLVNAMDAYHRRFGCYPPDNHGRTNPPAVDPILNPLLYELSGVLFDADNEVFTGTGFPPLTTKEVASLFRLTCFTNAIPAKPGAVPESFLNSLQTTVLGIHEMPDVSTFGHSPPPEIVDPEVAAEFDISPWRYVSSDPTNNPGKYDLWMELSLGKRKQVIGNWQAVE